MGKGENVSSIKTTNLYSSSFLSDLIGREGSRDVMLRMRVLNFYSRMRALDIIPRMRTLIFRQREYCSLGFLAISL